MRFEIVYDPTDSIPLKLNAPTGINPALIVCLLAQLITALSSQAIPPESGLVIPAHRLPKIQ